MKKKSLLILLPALMMVLASCNNNSDDQNNNNNNDDTVEPTPGGDTDGGDQDGGDQTEETGAVTLPSVEHLTITADKMSAKVGETVTFTITPDTDYEVDTFKVNGEDVTVTQGKATATMVKSGLTVTATAKAKEYGVTLEFNKDQGSVTVDVEKAIVGDKVTFTVTPATDYAVKEFKVNDKVTTLDADGKATVDMVSGGLKAVATFESTKKYNVTINAATNGSVTSNPTEAKVGEDVELTINADKGYELTALVVNDTDIVEQVSNNKVTVQMVENGLTVAPTFSVATQKVTAIDETFQKSVEGSANANYQLQNDLSATYLPLAKGTTNIDLNGKTLTITTKNILCTNDLIENEEKTQVVKISNGKIVVTATNDSVGAKNKFNLFNISEAKSFELDGVTVTTQNEITTRNAAAIHCSNANTITIQNSTIDTKTVFGLSTNNLERPVDTDPLTVNVTNSKITVTTTDGDNCAFITNVNTATNVKIDDSTLTGDRQAVIARTGTYEIKNSTLKSTEKWLKSKEYNDTRLTTWGNGNEVTSTPLCVGDLDAGSYNYNAVAKLENVTFDSSNSKNLVARQDGTAYTTSVEMDALTYLHTYSMTDIADGITFTEKNVLEKTITEVNALEDTDDTNLYVVSGNVKEITNTSYGNGTLLDDDGNTLVVYGSYTSSATNNYTYSDGAFVFDKTDATALDTTYVGKQVTLIGTFKIHYSTKEIINAVAFVEDADANITVEYDNTKGEVTLSNTNAKVGDEIEVTATPNSGFKLTSIKVTTYGATEDITESKKFVAALTTKVVVEFVDESAPELSSYTILFNSTNNSKKTNSYTDTFENTSDGITYTVYGFNNNNNGWDYVKSGKNSTITTKNVFANKIGSVDITFDEVSSSKFKSATLLVASDKEFKNDLQEITISAKKGTVSTNVNSPATNMYYQIKIVGTDTKSSTISKVVFNEVA